MTASRLKRLRLLGQAQILLAVALALLAVFCFLRFISFLEREEVRETSDSFKSYAETLRSQREVYLATIESLPVYRDSMRHLASIAGCVAPLADALLQLSEAKLFNNRPFKGLTRSAEELKEAIPALQKALLAAENSLAVFNKEKQQEALDSIDRTVKGLNKVSEELESRYDNLQAGLFFALAILLVMSALFFCNGLFILSVCRPRSDSARGEKN